MCAITGVIDFRKSPAYEDVSPMVDALRRRGPDGKGIEKWRSAVLGHCRLSIFDLSAAGRQPMLSPDRRIGVVFNGAIYNFKELRSELEGHGYRFRSNTDTEVLVHGYDHWGIDALVARLRGMFAFAVWDDRKQRLFLVRDRLGVKPFVYSIQNGRLAFASTMRGLREGGYAGELDDESVLEFLEHGFVPDHRGIYRDAFKLPAGAIGEWDGERLTIRNYWTLPEAGSAGKIDFEDAVRETERIFLESVRLRLQADVPVGALLSGGIDSSLVCWAISRLGSGITAFTVGTPGDVWDETADASATARELGIPHRVLQLEPSAAPDIDALVEAYGEPFACASALGMLQVSQAVREKATVLLTGDGGDDVFLGYPEHLHFLRAQQLANAMPRIAAPLWRMVRPLMPKMSLARRAKHFMDYAVGGLGAVTAAHDGLPLYQRAGLLGPRLQGMETAQRRLSWDMSSARRLVTDFLNYDRRMRFTGEYMTKVDGGTMHHALEARAPFLDQELWNFAASLPVELRLRGGNLKAILRELARRHLGERVASGKKRGFGIPVQRWISGPWNGMLADVFQNSLAARAGIVNEAKVREQIARVYGTGGSPKQLWYLFVLESWLRRESVQASPRFIAEVRAHSPL
jgi:asparagine synthase (glutamine-hydrolysing)